MDKKDIEEMVKEIINERIVGVVLESNTPKDKDYHWCWTCESYYMNGCACKARGTDPVWDKFLKVQEIIWK